MRDEELTIKETRIRDVEKELDHARKEIKSLQKRLETVKGQSEQHHDKLIQSQAENHKFKETLTGANKAIRAKD